jgi:hypothetical protein
MRLFLCVARRAAARRAFAFTSTAYSTSTTSSTAAACRHHHLFLLLLANCLLFLLLLAAGPTGAGACLIAGTDSGTCYNVFEENQGVETNVFDEGCNDGQCNLFCGEILSPMRSICVPRLDAAFSNHTYQNKDAWVEDMFRRITDERKALEMNATMMELGVTEYGDEGETEVRFWNWDYEDPDGIKFSAQDGGTEITDCEKSFRRYMCYLNFPRCDAEKNSLIMCRSVCENYMRACQIPSYLHRCGDALYMYDSGPEFPKQDPNTLEFDIFFRAPFPGSPFRDYEEDASTDPVTVIPTCTPSVKGASDNRHSVGGAAMTIVVAVVVAVSSL